MKESTHMLHVSQGTYVLSVDTTELNPNICRQGSWRASIAQLVKKYGMKQLVSFLVVDFTVLRFLLTVFYP